MGSHTWSHHATNLSLSPNPILELSNWLWKLQSLYKVFLNHFFWTCVIVRFLVFKARGAFQSEGDSWALAIPATTFQITEITHKEIDTYTHTDTHQKTPAAIPPWLPPYLSICLPDSFPPPPHSPPLFQLSESRDWHIFVPPGIVELTAWQTHNSGISYIWWQLPQSFFRLRSSYFYLQNAAFLSHK